MSVDKICPCIYMDGSPNARRRFGHYPSHTAYIGTKKTIKKNYVYFLRSLIIGVHVHDSPLDQTSPEVLQFYVFLWNPLYLAWVPLGPRSTSWISILRFSTVSENRMLPSILWFIDVYSKKKNAITCGIFPILSSKLTTSPQLPKPGKGL